MSSFLLKNTELVIDPPNGEQYGFPKTLPRNWCHWEWEEKKRWFIQEGYPKEEIDGRDVEFFYCVISHKEIA